MKIPSAYIAARRRFGSDQREVIVAYVESYDDQRLWSNVLDNDVIASKNIKIEFKVPSLDSEANGKATLINSVSEGRLSLGKNLIVCVDSDFDHLFGCEPESKKGKFYNSDFTFQTYTHSAENHYYTTTELEKICESSACTSLHIDFCIISYVEAWSRAIFELYTKIIYLRYKKQHQDYKKHFEKLNVSMESIFSGKLNANKFAVLLSRFESKVEAHLNELNKLFTFDSDYEDFLVLIKSKGFDEKNVNFYYRGHDLENRFISNICVSLCISMIANQRSKIYQANVGKKAKQQIEEYENNLACVKTAIKQRTRFLNNPFYDQVKSEFLTICNAHYA
ncbi:DUF4435 domain-containing protein [Vibrio sp. ED002]|uniref:DUF4435 domain-containing protein n=1 Tax=Vibrio sp. ED002 TaxID=2785123 RepID=UPI00201066F5|nr:DUF4435 domain-containing protein [Vibrio sp. ED002]UQA53956.1 DUF4435 domain-containing protein [Vibrio sp. ED002]